MVSAAVAYDNKLSVTFEIIGKNDFAFIYRFYRRTAFCPDVYAASENWKIKYRVNLRPVLQCNPAGHRPGEFPFQLAEPALLLDLFLSGPRPCFKAAPLSCLPL